MGLQLLCLGCPALQVDDIEKTVGQAITRSKHVHFKLALHS